MLSLSWFAVTASAIGGFGSLLGGPERWAGRGLRGAVGIARLVGCPAYLLWGIPMAVACLLILGGMLGARPAARTVGYGIGFMWSAVFGAAFAEVALTDPHASGLGTVWLPVASMFLVLGRRARTLTLTSRR